MVDSWGLVSWLIRLACDCWLKRSNYGVSATDWWRDEVWCDWCCDYAWCVTGDMWCLVCDWWCDDVCMWLVMWLHGVWLEMWWCVMHAWWSCDDICVSLVMWLCMAYMWLVTWWCVVCDWWLDEVCCVTDDVIRYVVYDCWCTNNT